MRKQPNKKMIGFFMLMGLLVFVMIIAKFLSDKIFTDDKNMVVMYFEESVDGLNVGSPVVFKGVEIGKVVKIDLKVNQETLEFSIPVYVRLMPNQQITEPVRNFEQKWQELDAFVKKGLRARLVSQSFVTGQLMIELEMLPDTPVVFRGKPGDEVLEIPTVLSPMGELSKGIQDLPFRQMFDRFDRLLGEMEKKLPPAVDSFTQMSQNINKVVTQNAPAAKDTLANVNNAFFNVGEAAKALRNFADYIERHPESLFTGKGDY